MQFDENLKNSITDEIIKNINPEAVESSMKEFILMQQIYNAGIKEIKTKLEILDDECQVKYDHNPIHHIEYRLKSPKSIVEKLRRKGHEVSIKSIKENLYDIAGVRVICNYIDDIYKIAEFLAKQDDIQIVRVRDYIKNPKENGYRSLHIIVSIPIFLSDGKENINVEIQIRTIAMDFWASLEHQLKYKSTAKDTPTLRENLKDCAAAINEVDMKMQNIYKELFE